MQSPGRERAENVAGVVRRPDDDDRRGVCGLRRGRRVIVDCLWQGCEGEGRAWGVSPNEFLEGASEVS